MSEDNASGRNEADTERSATGPMSRRGVLRATSAAVVGAAGAGAMTGTAAAGEYGCDYSFPGAPSWLGEVRPEPWEFHNWPWGTGDVTIFVHGFTNTNGGRDYAYELYRHLSDNGYGGHVVTCNWNAGDSWDEWYSAKEHSIEAGQRLAEILDYYGWTADHGVNVNLVAHSLGGKFALECVRHLQGYYGHSIHAVHLLGAAVWDEQPSERFYDGILYGTDRTHNYYSENDDVLGDAYQSAEFGRHACGYTGARAGAPWNWVEHDVTDRIHQHCEYLDYNDGVLWWVDDDL